MLNGIASGDSFIVAIAKTASVTVSGQPLNVTGTISQASLEAPVVPQTSLSGQTLGAVGTISQASLSVLTTATTTLSGQPLVAVGTLSRATLTTAINLTGYQEFTNYIRWSDDVNLGSTFAANGLNQVLNFADLNNNLPPGRVSLGIVGFNNRFTPEFEATGLIIFEASDGELLEVMIADADMSETYAWTPTNSAEVIAFVNHVRSLSDQTATLTLTGDTTPIIPTTTIQWSTTNISSDYKQSSNNSICTYSYPASG